MESYRRVISAIAVVAAALAGAAPAAAGEIAYQRNGDIWLMKDNFAGQHLIIDRGTRPHIPPRGGLLVFQGAHGSTQAVYKFQNNSVKLLTSGLADSGTLRQWAQSPEAGGDGSFDYTFVQAVPESGGPPDFTQIRGLSLNSTGLGVDYGVCNGSGDSGYPEEPSPNPRYDEIAYTGCVNGGQSLLRIATDSGEYGVAVASLPEVLTQASYSPDGLDLVYVWRSADTGGNSAIYVSQWNGSGYDAPQLVLDPSDAVVTSPRFIDGDLDGTGDWIIFGYDDGSGGATDGLYWILANGAGDAHLVAAGGSNPAWVAGSIYPPPTPPPPKPPSGSKPIPPAGTTPKPIPNVSKALRSQLKSAAKSLSKLGAMKLLKRKGFKIKRFKAVVAGKASGAITRRGVRIAAGSKRFSRAGRKTLYLKASRKGRAALARKIVRGRSFKVKLTLKFKTRSGKTYRASKSVKLKVPKKKAKAKPKPSPNPSNPGHTWLNPCIPAPWYMGGCLAY